MKIFAVDPGNEKSAYAIWDGHSILKAEKLINDEMKQMIEWKSSSEDYDMVAIEKIESYGMPIGATVIDTAVWIGRFIEALQGVRNDYPHQKIILIPRKQVKLHLCNATRAKDSNVIQALKDRFEPGLQPRERPKGLLKGLKADMWQAFALSVYVYDFLQGGGDVEEFEVR